MGFGSCNLGFLFLGEKTRGRQTRRRGTQMGRLGQTREVEHGAGDGGDLTGQPLDRLRSHLVDVAHVVDDVHNVLHVLVHLTYRVNLGRR